MEQLLFEMDKMMFVYAAFIVVCLYGLCLFLWWWFRVKRATVMYAYVTALFLVQIIEKLILAHSRHLYFCSALDYSTFITSSVWTLKTIVVLVVFFLIDVHMTLRIVKESRIVRIFNERKKSIPSDEFKNIVMFVDDNDDVLNMAEKSFDLINIKMHRAHSSQEALEILRLNPDLNLCFIDLNLGEKSQMTGEELGTKIKTECPWSILVAVTGFSDKYTFLRSRASGFDDYFVKPYPVKTLLDATERQLRRLERWKQYRNDDKRKERSCFNR